MKKTIIALALAALVIAASGCGKKEAVTVNPVQEAVPAVEEKKTVEQAPAVTTEPAVKAETSVPEKEEPAAAAEAPAQTAEAPALIGEEAAKRIALENAGLAESAVSALTVKLDTNDRFVHYDVDFVSGDYEYEYEIAAYTGDIIDIDKDYEKNLKAEKTSGSVTVSEEEAVEIALKHAGVSRSDVKKLKAELDRDDLIRHYEIEFECNGYEYEYDINAKTGKIMSSEKERD